MSTPEAAGTENGQRVVPQRKVRVLFPEGGRGEAGSKGQIPTLLPPSLSLQLVFLSGFGVLSWFGCFLFRFPSSLTPLDQLRGFLQVSLSPQCSCTFPSTLSGTFHLPPLPLRSLPPSGKAYPRPALIHGAVQVPNFFCSHLLSRFSPSPT